MNSFWTETFLPLAGSTIRVSIPLLFAALGGLLSERSGVINIALEGLMLVGAFTAAAVTYGTHSPWIGAAAGMGAGMALAAFYALFVIRLRSNQIVAGTAINMIAAGVTPFLAKILYGSTNASPAIPLEFRFQEAPPWIAVTILFLIALWLYRTPSGL